jgi:hypothetical protein
MRTPAPVERCELCGAELPPEHQHVLDPARRQLACACDACALLFVSAPEGRFRALPRRSRFLKEFRCSDALWDSLGVPIHLAFFRRTVADNRIVAVYPSPAGPVESLPSPESWAALAEANPMLAPLEADVEALLAHRVGAADEWFVTPIDECYRLIGLIRESWQGLGGGPQVWARVQAFFARLKQQAIET